MFQRLLARLVDRGPKPKLFTSAQLLETFEHAYRAGQAAGPAEPVVHRSWADIIAEAEAERAERAAVLPLAGRR